MADDMARHSISLAMQMTERAASMIATEVTAVTNLLEAAVDYDNRAGREITEVSKGWEFKL